MNVDLKNALLEVQNYFLEAKINGNVVEFTAPELSTKSLVDLGQMHKKNSRLNPWVFRSDMEVKVIVFIKDEQGNYIGAPAILMPETEEDNDSPDVLFSAFEYNEILSALGREDYEYLGRILLRKD